MKTLLPTTLLASLGLGFALAGCGDAGLSEAAARGRAVFFEHSNPTCASCHGLPFEGTQSAPNIPNLSGRVLDLAKVQKAVTQGIGIMPAQKGVLTKDQIEDVATYVTEAVGLDSPPNHEPYTKATQ